jgi:hemin uptake protein HemP
MNEIPHPDNVQDGASSSAPQTAAPVPAAAPREAWRSEELLGERTEVLIQHGTETYRLRRTRQGKLILYK